MSDLPDDPELLKALVKQLLEKIKQLEAENAELRRRLGLDSTKSHKPPSSDGYRKKPVAAGLPKETGRRNGGRKGIRAGPSCRWPLRIGLKSIDPGSVDVVGGSLPRTSLTRSSKAGKSLTYRHRSWR